MIGWDMQSAENAKSRAKKALARLSKGRAKQHFFGADLLMT